VNPDTCAWCGRTFYHDGPGNLPGLPPLVCSDRCRRELRRLDSRIAAEMRAAGLHPETVDGCCPVQPNWYVGTRYGFNAGAQDEDGARLAVAYQEVLT